MIHTIEQVTGMSVPTQVIDRRAIDLALPISNPEKAYQELRWKASRTLHESIGNTWKFLSRVRSDVAQKKNPRVLHFLPYFPPHAGGVEMYAQEWAENYTLE